MGCGSVTTAAVAATGLERAGSSDVEDDLFSFFAYARALSNFPTQARPMAFIQHVFSSFVWQRMKNSLPSYKLISASPFCSFEQ